MAHVLSFPTRWRKCLKQILFFSLVQNKSQIKVFMVVRWVWGGGVWQTARLFCIFHSLQMLIWSNYSCDCFLQPVLILFNSVSVLLPAPPTTPKSKETVILPMVPHYLKTVCDLCAFLARAWVLGQQNAVCGGFSCFFLQEPPVQITSSTLATPFQTYTCTLIEITSTVLMVVTGMSTSAGYKCHMRTTHTGCIDKRGHLRGPPCDILEVNMADTCDGN